MVAHYGIFEPGDAQKHLLQLDICRILYTRVGIAQAQLPPFSEHMATFFQGSKVSVYVASLADQIIKTFVHLVGKD
jgi:hypothetical protein